MHETLRPQLLGAPEGDQTLYQRLVELSPDAVVIHVAGVVAFLNPAGERLFRLDHPEEVIGRSVLDFVHPDDRERVEQRVRTMQSTGAAVSRVEERFLALDGTEIVGEVEAAPFTFRGERAILVVIRDVTERKRAADRMQFLAEASQALASSLDYAATLANVARLAVPRVADWCVVDLVTEEGGIERVAAAHADPEKERWAREVDRRYPPDERGATANVLRTRQSSLVPEVTDDMLVAVARDAEHLATLRQLGLRSGLTVPLQARGRILGAITFLVTESGRRFGPDDLREAEDLAQRAALAVDNARLYAQSLRRAAEHAAILGQMSEGVLMADMTGRLVYTNDAARRLFGLPGDPPARPFGSGMSRTYEMDGRAVAPGDTVLGRALRGETVVDVQRLIRLPDGRDMIARTSASPLLAEDGTQFGAVATVRDVTAQYTLERQREDFLAAAAHDLKTPLAGIKGLAQMLARRASRAGPLDTERLLRDLEKIDATATRMAGLVNELLDGTRIYVHQPLELSRQPTDLVALARRVRRDQEQAGTRHRIVLQTEVAELIGLWDEPRLERVLGNLLSNAIKYSPGGGEIRVGVQEESREEDRWAVLTVQDSGLGIPAADLPRIFERFYRAANVPKEVSGTGIGLAGVQQIVEQHGGSVSVESREGEGSTFTVRLPLSGAAPGVARTGAAGG
ncbi:MAG: PAS domain S-box protein [Chloroflexi bacterium]|nr:PAS domain S-box protein [Chloroflexota bacterium]